MATGKKELMRLGFEKEIKVVLPPIESDGKWYKDLTHVFRQLTAEDRLNYYRIQSQAEVTFNIEGKPEKRTSGDYWKAIQELYDSCTLRYENYVFPDGCENWRDLMPLEHKQWAIELLLDKVGGFINLNLGKK